MYLHIEGRSLPEPEPATTAMALFVTTRAGMGRVARVREWGIGLVAGPPAVSQCYVTLRRERMVGPRAGLWNWDRSWETREAELGNFVSLNEANEMSKKIYTEAEIGETFHA